MFAIVVLPAPLGPSSPKSSPSATLRLIPFTAITSLLRHSFRKGADTRYVSLERYAPKDGIITLDRKKRILITGSTAMKTALKWNKNGVVDD